MYVLVIFLAGTKFISCTYILGRIVHSLIFLSTYFINEVESGVIVVKSFEWKDQEAACKHLGLQLQHSKQHVYQPYEYNFQSVDIPEVVQDCGADGDCFYRWVSKYL